MNDAEQKFYDSEKEIEALVRGLEMCTLKPEVFDHAAHLVVGLWYVSKSSETKATKSMRVGLLRFIAHNGVDPQKYNETITIFWVKWLRSFIDQTGASRPIEALANELIKTCPSANLIFSYFSKELIFTEEARRNWVEPDLKPLDF
jgi:hypothetical protein